MKSKIYSVLINFIANYGLIFGGFFILLMGIMALNKAKTQLDITQKELKVSVQIIEAPSDCDRIGRRGGFSKLKFNGRIFNKKTGRRFCDLVEGKEEIIMLTNTDKDKLIFMNEYEKEHNWISGIGLCLFGIVIAYKGWRGK